MINACGALPELLLGIDDADQGVLKYCKDGCKVEKRGDDEYLECNEQKCTSNHMYTPMLRDEAGYSGTPSCKSDSCKSAWRDWMQLLKACIGMNEGGLSVGEVCAKGSRMAAGGDCIGYSESKAQCMSCVSPATRRAWYTAGVLPPAERQEIVEWSQICSPAPPSALPARLASVVAAGVGVLVPLALFGGGRR